MLQLAEIKQVSVFLYFILVNFFIFISSNNNQIFLLMVLVSINNPDLVQLKFHYFSDTLSSS